MGCAGSKENDTDATKVRGTGTNYADMAEDAASMLSGSGVKKLRENLLLRGLTATPTSW